MLTADQINKKHIMAKKKESTKKKGDPCWEGYHKLGTKIKDGKKVPDCVPVGKKKSKD